MRSYKTVKSVLHTYLQRGNSPQQYFSNSMTGTPVTGLRACPCSPICSLISWVKPGGNFVNLVSPVSQSQRMQRMTRNMNHSMKLWNEADYFVIPQTQLLHLPLLVCFVDSCSHFVTDLPDHVQIPIHPHRHRLARPLLPST